MKVYLRNLKFKTYDNDIKALIGAFFPGAEIEENGETYFPGAETEETDLIIDIDKIAGDSPRLKNRFDDKTDLKRSLYLELKRSTGRELPWGTLTGIRPVRIVEMLKGKAENTGDAGKPCDAGKTGNTGNTVNVVDAAAMDDYIRGRLRERFLISDEKIRLVTDIAKREDDLLSPFDYTHGTSLYIGIPFCPTRCLYCSFASNPIDKWTDRTGEYIDSLIRELEGLFCGDDRRSEYIESFPVQTVYIGGGTPTALSAAELDRLLDAVAELTDKHNLKCETGYGFANRSGNKPIEFTVEAGRPDSITAEKLEAIKRHGAGRISINPQTFNQRTLDTIGRRHTCEQTVCAYRLARSMGFDNINMDIITGLPGESLADVRFTLERISELKPDSLTVHALAVKRASRLSVEGHAWSGIDRKGITPESAAEAMAMTALGAEYAGNLGMKPYYIYRQKNMAGNQENTGYAVPGKECLYNILMMEEKHSVFGIGAGASTKIVHGGAGIAATTKVSAPAAAAGTVPANLRKTERFANAKDIATYMSAYGSSSSAWQTG